MQQTDRSMRATPGRRLASRVLSTLPWRSVAGAWMVAVVVAGALVALAVPLVTGRSMTTPTASNLGTVQSQYALDLLVRQNAERAARVVPGQPVPPLTMDAGLNAAAQAWSARIAATGTVQDPPLAGCGPAPGPAQLCVLAGNAGNSGNGFWPGDGSDGMSAAYMVSAGHRENLLNAGYDTVGVGVTCSGGQAWTVELFGYAYGTLGPAQSRQAAQNAVEGNPVPASPMVAGTQTGTPVYCPGQVMGPNGAVTPTGGPYPYPTAVPTVPGESVTASPPYDPYVGIASTPGSGGYWLAKSLGTVSPHGTAVSYGSMAGRTLAAPITHIVALPNGRGYWLVGADGGIFNFGAAGFYGSMGGLALNAPVVDMASTPDGRGYWLVGADGGVFAFGDATFHGSTGGLALNAPVVGMTSDRSGGGYWLVGADGGVFAFGDATFHGSTGDLALNAPVVGMAPDTAGAGYWLVSADGGIFAFGSAPFRGSTGGLALRAPMAGMVTDNPTDGYWLVGTDGGVFAFGAPFAGAG